VEEQWRGYFDHRDSSHWLHFQQLDWERNWLVFRDEQFSFSHDERSYHRDGYFRPQSQPCSNADADGNSYSHSNSNADADANANTDGYAYPDANSNGYANVYPNTNGYACPDANTLTPTPRPDRNSKFNKYSFTREGWRWIVDAHREGRRYIVHSDELLSAFLSWKRRCFEPTRLPVGHFYIQNTRNSARQMTVDLP